jgi:hypothetical protein
MGTGGVLTGRYKQFGKSVFLSVYGLFGTSGATFGVGNWGWSLPVAANATNNMPRTGSAYFRDSSAAGSGHFVGICTIQPSLSVNTLNGFVPTGFAANTQVRETVPFTWAVNDFFALSIVYEAA